MATTRVAVVLSGCGFLDGSEIHEAVSVLIHLSRGGAEVRCFAPDQEQAQAVNHYTGEVEPRRQRNVLHESARIARGGPDAEGMGAGSPGCAALSELDASDWDAVIFPGGYGAARNLSTFAVDGAECDVHRDVARVVRTFHASRKPIGMCCVAPAIAARVLGKEHGGPGCTLTLGGEGGAAEAARKMGATHKACGVRDICVDDQNLLVTTPAYMLTAPVHEVFEGIGKMVDRVVSMAGAAAAAR